MATATKKLGPADHGRVLSLEEYLGGRYREGYHYELIDGKLYVTPAANVPEDVNEKWLYAKLLLYSLYYPEIIRYLSNKARVFVPGGTRPTAPEPDLAAYRDFPLLPSGEFIDWQNLNPFLVAEVLSPYDPSKDLKRNVALYLRVPSILEYWVLDGRDNVLQPRLLVHRRHRGRWRSSEVAFGETYTTPLLPGFKLLLDPHK